MMINLVNLTVLTMLTVLTDSEPTTINCQLSTINY